MGVKEERVSKWEQDGQLTMKQAEKLAKTTNTAIGYLFLSEPPREQLPISDFRTIGSEELQHPSSELLDVIYQTQRQQDWYRDYQLSIGADPLPFIGSADLNTSIISLAQDMRKELDYSVAESKSAKDWQDALRQLIKAIEKAGVLVMYIGYAGTNTRRTLEVAEFRGFALSDPLAPLIFINGKDAKPAQMFTIAHELVHLWLGESGVSKLEKTFSPEGAQQIEFFCNQVAAEFLVPLNDLTNEINKTLPVAKEIKRLASTYRVSTLVMARRFKDANLLNWDNYRAFYDAEVEGFRAKKKGSGGDPYATLKTKNSGRFSEAVYVSTMEGKTPRNEAHRLLGIKTTKTFNRYLSDFKATY
jgi:Zn-dependent peptidase ImmA (M78 family)